MLRKLKTLLGNLPKLKRDAYIETQRLRYRANSLHKSVLHQIHLQKPKVQQTLQKLASLKPSIDPKQLNRARVMKEVRNWDGKWATARDKLVDFTDTAVKSFFRVFVSLYHRINVPSTLRTTWQYGKATAKDSAAFINDKLSYSKQHMRSYFQANQQWFAYYKRRYLSFSPRTKRGLVLFGTAAGLIYGVGFVAKRQVD